MELKQDEKGLYIEDDGMVLRADFSRIKRRTARGTINSELLVKAAKIKNAEGPLLAIDATAGMGEDSFLLAAAGFSVLLYEYDPMIAALLKDTVERAKCMEGLSEIAARMQVIEGDSIAAMKACAAGMGNSSLISCEGAAEENNLAAAKTASVSDCNGMPEKNRRVDVVYLDPMFPERKKSALVKKKFQMIHGLEAPCENEEELLSAALSLNPRKIIIKRPLKGPWLSGVKPDYSLEGKAIRYDVILGQALLH